jgi:Secretion system C-terminal sorting domain
MKKNLLATLILCLITLICLGQNPVTILYTSILAPDSTKTYATTGGGVGAYAATNNFKIRFGKDTASIERIDSYKCNIAGSLKTFARNNLNYTVKIRRVNNPVAQGTNVLMFSRGYVRNDTVSLRASYVNNMEQMFKTNYITYGSDNFFGNQGDGNGNNNNIERLDIIYSRGFITTTVNDVGFSIFERGATGAHDPFRIAAIKKVDAQGNPLLYGKLVRVAPANYGHVSPTDVNYVVMRMDSPQNVLHPSTTVSQGVGGVMVTLGNLGILAGDTTYGFSLFGDDVGTLGTNTGLVNYNNATVFPTNSSSATGAAGGLDIMGFSAFSTDRNAVITYTVPLPVKLTSFTAHDEATDVSINWGTATETNSSKYIIERSTDAYNFDEILEQPAAGNSTQHLDYHAVDAHPLPGNNYYRLKEIDIDGKIQYSDVVSVKYSGTTAEPTIYPNPATNLVTISIGSGEIYQYQLLDMLGNTARIGEISQAAHQIDIADLQSGLYILRVAYPGGIASQHQLIKQ